MNIHTYDAVDGMIHQQMIHAQSHHFNLRPYVTWKRRIIPTNSLWHYCSEMKATTNIQYADDHK